MSFLTLPKKGMRITTSYIFEECGHLDSDTIVMCDDAEGRGRVACSVDSGDQTSHRESAIGKCSECERYASRS
jgi:hypothetical protein